jgi:3-oxoacyl-[acyl-carrier-protein] synthase II
MKRRRVKITGIGPVTPAGIGRQEFWEGILSERSFIRPYRKLGDDNGPFVAAFLSSFDVRKHIGDFSLPKGTARHTQFAAAGMMLALSDAGIGMAELAQRSCSIITGSSLLDFGGIGGAIESVQKRGTRGAQARVVYTTTLTSVSDVLSRICGAAFRTMVVQTSCCAGLDAIGQAARLVAGGESDIAICGGTEAPLHRFPMLELRAAGLTPVTEEFSARIARPFDRWRTTGVVSEGACMFVLEPESSPRPGYAFVSGYSFAIDDGDDLCSGLLSAGRLALAEARLSVGDVEAVNAWGPGHKLIDRAESLVLEKMFGKALSNIPAVSIKGAVGAALGAAPAMQVAAAALGLSNGIVPATVNWEFPDPSCPLSLSNRNRLLPHDVVLVNAHGVGNINSSMVLLRC